MEEYLPVNNLTKKRRVDESFDTSRIEQQQAEQEQIEHRPDTMVVEEADEYDEIADYEPDPEARTILVMPS